MISSANNNVSGSLAIDANGLNGLSRAAKENSPEALKAAAKQFESMFMNMVLKSMRDASPQDGIFDNEQSKTFTSMLDQQMSQNFADRGVGLADMLIRQLSNNRMGSTSVPALEEQPVTPFNADLNALIGDTNKLNPRQAAQLKAYQERMADPMMPGIAGLGDVAPAARSNSSQPAHVRSFQERFAADAADASRSSGIPAKFMLGQAALETGWGKREIRGSDGSASHNLFGIKATGGWKGNTVDVVTTEYSNGVPETKVQKFRAYDNYADSFRDYAKLISTNPRYENVMANTNDAAGFAQGLQRAGYATDPNYAAKLSNIINNSLAS